MTETDRPHIPPESHADLAHAVMRRQAMLSIRVAAVFLAMLFGLPLVNYGLPSLANMPVMGFTATWLFLAVLFYPITWVLSWYFIKESDRIESECSDWRAVLGVEAGEPLEPEGVGDIKPAFIESDEIPSPGETLEPVETATPQSEEPVAATPLATESAITRGEPTAPGDAEIGAEPKIQIPKSNIQNPNGEAEE